VLKHWTENIFGINIINTHHLWFDPIYREVFFNKSRQTNENENEDAWWGVLE